MVSDGFKWFLFVLMDLNISIVLKGPNDFKCLDILNGLNKFQTVSNGFK